MTIDETIRVLSNERACVMRNTAGACDRNCAACDLVLPDDLVISAYRTAVDILRAYREGNAPLTMTRLLEMDGKPVYIVFKPGPNASGWYLVQTNVFDFDDVFFTSPYGDRFELHEINGRFEGIYRRPPEEAKS